MKKVISLFNIALCVFLIFSCSSESHKESLSNASFLESIKKVILSDSSLTLTIPEYLNWIKEQHGITYNQEDNNEFELAIIYKPLVLEAALSASLNGDITSKNLKKYEEIKKGYHYFEITYLSKNISVTHPVDKNLLLKKIQNNIFVYSNSDTIRNPIIELFPSSIQNQPHKILMIVENKQNTGIIAGVTGKSLGTNDIRIDITKQQIANFPKIKI